MDKVVYFSITGGVERVSDVKTSAGNIFITFCFYCWICGNKFVNLYTSHDRIGIAFRVRLTGLLEDLNEDSAVVH